MGELKNQTGRLGDTPKNLLMKEDDGAYALVVTPDHIAKQETDLGRIFRLQNELDQYIAEKYNLDFNDTNLWINNLLNAIIDEVSEVRNETNWKWWKREKELDMEAIHEEVIDLWHFLVSLSIRVGLTPEMVLEVYERKNQINIDRQDGKTDKEGYA